MAEIGKDPREPGRCPLCERGDAGRVAYRFHPSRADLPPLASLPADHEFHVARCTGCGLHFLHPRLTREAAESIYSSMRYYVSGGGGGGYDDYGHQEEALRRTFRRFLEALRGLGLTGGAVADIGCGFGFFLDEARPFFRVRMGTEMCNEVVDQAAARCDRVVCGGPAELLVTGSRFDLVVSIGVLEHVYDPVTFMRACSELTRKNGAVVLVTPNMTGLWRRLMGRFWPSFKLPEHIAFYDRRTLAILGSKAGMPLRRVFLYHQAFPFRLILKKLGWHAGGSNQLLDKSMFLPGVMMAAVFQR